MENVLVGYATTEGHTRKIASFVAERIRVKGATVTLIDLAEIQPEDLSVYDAAVLAGSLHQTKHQSPLVHFAKAHAPYLNVIPSAFLSVSLSAAGKTSEDQADAQRCVDEFARDTGWNPATTRCVAGALLFTQYDFLKRFLLKMISRAHGGDTDTSRDYEYTDWEDLGRFVDQFMG